MAKSLLERRLIDVSDRLKRLRAELAVADEQCTVLVGEAEDARLRSLVSETPLAQAEAHEMRRHADAQSRQRDALRRSIEELERDQDALLDRMTSELSSQMPSSQIPSSQTPSSQTPSSSS
jgi:chromosome segregation ATPase